MPLAPLLHPKYWLSWVGYGLVYPLAFLSHHHRTIVGAFFGKLLYLFLPSRRHIVLTNLSLVMPELLEAERVALMKENFKQTGISLIDTLHSWWGKIDYEAFTLLGAEHLVREEGKGAVIVSMHQLPVDICVIYLSHHSPLLATFKPPRSLVMRYLMYRARAKHLKALVNISNPRQSLRALRNGELLWIANDQDTGKKNDVFVPFMGVVASTPPVVSQLVKATQAKVLGYYFYRTETGYVGQIVPLNQVKGDDVEQETSEINASHSHFIRQHPAQYFWMHRRFKTQLDGRDLYYTEEN